MSHWSDVFEVFQSSPTYPILWDHQSLPVMSDSTNSTGYGPTRRYNRLYFNGDSEKFELWEEKFMGYLKLKKLKTVIKSTTDPLTDAGEIEKNEEAYAELNTSYRW